jgi:hypothetical protein
VRNVLPDLLSNTLEVVKLTALGSVVAVPELLYQARQAQSLTYNADADRGRGDHLLRDAMARGPASEPAGEPRAGRAVALRDRFVNAGGRHGPPRETSQLRNGAMLPARRADAMLNRRLQHWSVPPRRALIALLALGLTYAVTHAPWSIALHAEPDRSAISRSGVLGGASYLLEVPAGWQGGLVVFAHGIQRGPGAGAVAAPPIAGHIHRQRSRVGGIGLSRARVSAAPLHRGPRSRCASSS